MKSTEQMQANMINDLHGGETSEWNCERWKFVPRWSIQTFPSETYKKTKKE